MICIFCSAVWTAVPILPTIFAGIPPDILNLNHKRYESALVDYITYIPFHGRIKLLA